MRAPPVRILVVAASAAAFAIACERSVSTREDVELSDGAVGVVERQGTSPHWATYVTAREQMAAGDIAAAEKTYQQLAALEPDEPDPYLGLGTTAVTRGDFAGAERQWLHALALDASNVPALYALGGMYLQTGELEKADEVYRRALAIEPCRAEVRYGLALLAEQRGSFVEALCNARVFLAADNGSGRLAGRMRQLVADATLRGGVVGECPPPRCPMAAAPTP